MPPVTRLALPLAAALLLAGCGDDEAASPTAAAPTATPTPAALSFHRDVEPILHRSCLSCHHAGGSAPLTLETWDQVRAAADLVARAVSERTMPPWGVDASGACNAYQDPRWLTDAEIATVVAWADGARAQGDPADAPPPFTPAVEALAHEDAILDMGVSYSPRTDRPDDYRCFIVDPGLDADRFLTAYHVHPGDLRVVHHVLVYDVLSEDGVAAVEALDAADAGPGYTCFGGPGTGSYNILGAWAPGTPLTRLPEGTGLRVSASRPLVLQIHYNQAPSAAADRTTVGLELEEEVAQPAQMIITGDFDLVVPGNTARAETFVELSPSDLGAPLDATVWGVFPHMHTLGQTLQVDFRGLDRDSCLSRVPAWDFNWQQAYFFETPLKVNAEDLVRLTCTFDTRGRDGLVAWGEGTQDEMCVALFYLTFGDQQESLAPPEVGEAVSFPRGVPSLGAAPTAQWSRALGGVAGDTARQIALTGDGAYVTLTTSSPTLSLDGPPVRLPGGGDGALIKLDEDGDVLWSRVLGGAGDDGLYAVAATPDGGAVIGGWIGGDATVDGAPLAWRGGRDVAIARFDAQGTLLWARTFGDTGADFLRGLAVGDDGAVYAGGYFSGTLDLGETTLAASSGQSGFLLALDAVGAPRWAQGCLSPNACQLRDVAAGPGGAVAGVGYFSGEALLGGQTVASRGSRDAFVAVFDALTGAPRWTRTLGDTEPDALYSVSFDPDGGLWATGGVSGTVDLDDARFTFAGSVDAVILRLDPEGEARWITGLGGVAGDYGYDIVPDGAGGALLTAAFEGLLPTDLGELDNGGGVDAALLRLSPEGAVVWAQQLGARGGDYYPYVDAQGGVAAVTLSSPGPLEVGDEVVRSSGGTDVMVLSFDL